MTYINYETKLFLVVNKDGNVTSFTTDPKEFWAYLEKADQLKLSYDIETNNCGNVTICRFR